MRKRMQNIPLVTSDPFSVSLIKAGDDTYEDSNRRWGDYSNTSLDPTDSLTIWTIQEYAEPHSGANHIVWGTRIAPISSP
jgi:hypothetical protein